MNSSAIGASRYTRLADVQTWPALSSRAQATPGTATSRSASAKTMNGSTLPSSRLTFLSSCPQIEAMDRPAATEPVKATRSTRGCRTRASPVTGPPVITFTTPGGRPSRQRASSSVESGFWCGGLQTTVFPAASAGASFQASSSSGKLNGTMAATTPNGSLMVKFTWCGATGGIEFPKLRRPTSA